MNKLIICVVSLGLIAAGATLFMNKSNTLSNIFDQPQRTQITPTKNGEMRRFTQHSSPIPLAKLKFTDPDGKIMTIDDFHGKVILMNFWASWCGPCRVELPELDRLQQELQSDKFEVILMSQDTKFQASLDMLKDMKIKNLTTYHDKKRMMGRTYFIKGLPTTLLLNEKGEEIGRLIGPAHWASNEAKTLLNAFID